MSDAAHPPEPPRATPGPDDGPLAGRLLLAMPATGGVFRRSVVLLVAHGAGGAMGLIVNRRHPRATLGGLLDALGIARGAADAGGRLHVGGPVEPARGFVLHRAGWTVAGGTARAARGLALTGSRAALSEIAAGRGPHAPLVAMGHAGWAPGQLEAEIARDAWLVAPSDPALVLDAPDAEKWPRALRGMGVAPEALAAVGGRA